MAVQTVPYALQNASHSAAVFRQSASAPFASGGILGVGELAITQQSTPNMSVVLGAGRSKVPGTSVSPPAGFSWTTQAMYDVLNDAPLTLTIAASNPTNPRIDAVYEQVQDSFYSGTNNQAIAGVVTGAPAAIPTAPAIPTNAILLGYIAVAANATTIVNANITTQAAVVVLASGPHTAVVNRAISALNQFSNPTSATDFPVSADATALLISFTKKIVGSALLIFLSIPMQLGSGSAQNLGAVINVAGTDYPVSLQSFPTAISYGMVSGVVLVSGVAAGSVVVKPRVISATGAVVNVNQGTIVSYSVTEVSV